MDALAKQAIEKSMRDQGYEGPVRAPWEDQVARRYRKNQMNRGGGSPDAQGVATTAGDGQDRLPVDQWNEQMRIEADMQHRKRDKSKVVVCEEAVEESTLWSDMQVVVRRSLERERKQWQSEQGYLESTCAALELEREQWKARCASLETRVDRLEMDRGHKKHP